MNEVPIWRLYALRAMYLFMAAGLFATMWPAILSHAESWPLMNGVVACMLGALGLMAALGLRYPLQMIPILLFELLWKTIWLTAVALPLWRAGRMDAATAQTVLECALVVLVALVLPWRYVWTHHVRKPGDRWRAAAGAL